MDIQFEAEVVVIAADYLRDYGSAEEARTGLRDRAYTVVAQRVADAAFAELGDNGPALRARIPDVVVEFLTQRAIAATYAFVALHPDEAATIFELLHAVEERSVLTDEQQKVVEGFRELARGILRSFVPIDREIVALAASLDGGFSR